jgi:pimeloyl-ACP methyl ester carboxylesterase
LRGVSGSPGPVLLLHGQPGAGRDWDRVIAALGSRARPIAIDRPGWDGASPARDLAGNAEAAIAALDGAGVAQATIVGHSFGAAIACQVAVDHPDRVAGLLLVAPAANTASLYRLDRLLAVPVLGDLGSLVVVGAPALALRTRPTRGLIARTLRLSNEHLEAVGHAFGRRHALRAFSVEQRSLVRDLPALEARLPWLDVPTTVMIGRRDVVVPVGSARRLADTIPDAELIEIPGAGHLLPLRHADEVAAAITRQVSPG